MLSREMFVIKCLADCHFHLASEKSYASAQSVNKVAFILANDKAGSEHFFIKACYTELRFQQQTGNVKGFSSLCKLDMKL